MKVSAAVDWKNASGVVRRGVFEDVYARRLYGRISLCVVSNRWKTLSRVAMLI